MALNNIRTFSLSKTFKKAPGYWQDLHHQKEFVTHLESRLGLKSKEEWYSVTQEEIKKHGGLSVLRKYEDSTSKMLTTLFPEHKWSVHEFDKVPQKHWDSIENQRLFLDDLGAKLGFTRMDDLYSLKTNDVIRFGGTGILHKYNDSISSMLTTVYSNHTWQIWRFSSVPNGYWDTVNYREVMDWVSNKLHLRSLYDWYRVSQRELEDVISLQILKNHSLPEILKRAYPDHPWNSLEFKANARKKSQRVLETKLKQIFPNTEMKWNYLPPELRMENDHTLELDVYLPNERIGFEYQGEQHYQGIYSMGLMWRQLQRDSLKRELCTRENITLIEIPYWWNFETDSLRATINQYRTDLCGASDNSQAIPRSPPSNFTFTYANLEM